MVKNDRPVRRQAIAALEAASGLSAKRLLAKLARHGAVLSGLSHLTANTRADIAIRELQTKGPATALPDLACELCKFGTH